ncbi:MAG: acetate--CoA ligase family protein [Hyphomicrobiales bacterium]
MFGLDDALTAFEAAAMIGQNWARTDMLPPVDAASTDGPVSTLTEFEAKQLLKERGLPCPMAANTQHCGCASLCGGLGFPVTLKIASAAIAHKSDVGAWPSTCPARPR